MSAVVVSATKDVEDLEVSSQVKHFSSIKKCLFGDFHFLECFLWNLAFRYFALKLKQIEGCLSIFDDQL